MPWPVKHGLSRTRTYRIWIGIVRRCNTPSHMTFPKYGGIGIKLCERWLDFEKFFSDMGECPSKDHSIDRYPDNDGNYEPNNCRWATRKEQKRNCSNNRHITFNGETLCLAEWAERIGIGANALGHRIDRYGWPLEKALTTRKL